MNVPAGRAASPALAGTRLDAAVFGSAPLAVRPIEPSPCSTACPAGVNVKAYVSLIAEGKYAEALAVVRERCPLPGICGRICHHPCEAACRSAEPIAIRALKRFVADVAETGPPPSLPVSHPDTAVAVVGSGPAGLTAAYELRRAGYPVTLYEAAAEPGGMLRYGIAPYRLPRQILDAEIGYLLASGIELRTGCRVGEDIELESLLGNGPAAVLFALGAQNGRSLGIPGESAAPEVEDALGFLRRVNGGDRQPLRGRVLVIGGGSTAVEAARTARRLGGDPVTILYRRSRRELLAGSEEIEACAREGIDIRFLVAPQAAVRDDERFIGLECLRVELGEADASGRRRPVPVPGSEFLIEADRVLAAVGQQADLGLLPERHVPRLSQRGRLRVGAESAMTAMQGVFAAGDVVTGPATVIDAVAAGQRAAATVLRYLQTGRPERPPAASPAPAEYGLTDRVEPPTGRHHPPMAPLLPGSEFAETERAFGPAEAAAEARRCLRCGPCSECRICASSCGRRHLVMRTGEYGTQASTALRISAELAASLAPLDGASGRLLAANQKGQVAVRLLPAGMRVNAELCRACGDCLEVCSFDALGLTAEQRAVSVDTNLCRGCQLCSAVCPTGAMNSDAWSSAWWADRLESVAQQAATAPPQVIVTCTGQPADWNDWRRLRRDRSVEIVTVRCAGSVDAGRLLELLWRGAGSVLVAGCRGDGCRFAGGAQLAVRHSERARSLLRMIGADPDRIGYLAGPGRAPAPLPSPPAKTVRAAVAGNRRA